MTVQRALKLLGVLVFASWISAVCLCFAIFGSPSLTNTAKYLAGQAVKVPYTWDDTVTLHGHPIKDLVRKAVVRFEEQLARQSKTLEEAASEYLQRYHRDPPPGFEMWYDFAIRHESLIIDDFDIINETLIPFWSLSGADLKRRVNDVLEDDWAIQHCEIIGGQVTGDCDRLGENVLYWLNDTDHSPDLPAVDLLVNVLDEPRVLYGDPGERVDKLEWTDNSRSSVWEELTAICTPGLDFEGKQTSILDHKAMNTALSFSDGKPDTLDLCEHPEYSRMHGLWDAPSNLKTTDLAVPILSSAVPSKMGDIPFPAAAYSSSMYTFDELEDIPWESKTPGLYWAGKTTGSIQSVASDWRHHHRQRFVRVANELASQPHLYLESLDHGTSWQYHNSIVMDGPLYQVYFTEIVQCEDEMTREAISSEFDIHEPDERAESFQYTLNFDLDGNGHSGRFYRLLNSRSLPLKQTVFREWHDERLQPWLHYVPISLGMEELPEVVRYLSVEDEGLQLAALLAAQGREWSLRALRPVDQAIYLYRLMLELARLQDPNRLAS
jgi:hypothetical protein